MDQEAGSGEQLSFGYDRSQEQMENVSQVLIRVEKLLQEAVAAGYSVNEAEKLYSLAEDAFDYQDYKKAEEYALQSASNLEEVLRPMHEDQLKAGEVNIPLSAEVQKPLREDLPKGEHAAGVLEQIGHQPKFGRGEVRALPGHKHPPLVQIDSQVAIAVSDRARSIV